MFNMSEFGRKTVSIPLAMKNFKIEVERRKQVNRVAISKCLHCESVVYLVSFETSHASTADLPNSFEVSHRGSRIGEHHTLL